jgi:preprotein translocase subunit YajC
VVLSLYIQAASPPNAIISFLPILAIFAIFYFLLFMPMQRQKKQLKKMLESLQPGNAVLTSGGIIGTIATLDADTIVLRVKPDNLKIQVARSAVSALIPEKEK